MDDAARKRARARRVRGYRFQIYHEGRPSTVTPTIWAEQPPQEAWERIIADPHTVKADLFRSGRKLKGYHFQRR